MNQWPQEPMNCSFCHEISSSRCLAFSNCMASPLESTAIRPYLGQAARPGVSKVANGGKTANVVSNEIKWTWMDYIFGLLVRARRHIQRSWIQLNLLVTQWTWAGIRRRDFSQQGTAQELHWKPRTICTIHTAPAKKDPKVLVARCKGPVEFQEVTGCPTEASRTGELVVRVSHAPRGIEFRQEPRHPGSVGWAYGHGHWRSILPMPTTHPWTFHKTLHMNYFPDSSDQLTSRLQMAWHCDRISMDFYWHFGTSESLNWTQTLHAFAEVRPGATLKHWLKEHPWQLGSNQWWTNGKPGGDITRPDHPEQKLTWLTLPLQLAVNVVLLQERGIVGFQGVNIWNGITLWVQIKLVELFHPFQGLCILRALQVDVSAFVVPRIEGMKPDHVEATFWKGASVEFQHLVHVLVMTPGHGQIADATRWLVHAELAAIHWVVVVRIAFERLREHNCIFSRCTSYWKGVSDNRPLFQDVISCNLGQSHNFAHVMKQPDQVEPVILFSWPLLPDPFCSLEIMNAVWNVYVWVRIIHQLIQHLDCLHDGVLAFVKPHPLLAHGLHKCHCLIDMHVRVCLLNLVLASGRLIVSVWAPKHILLWEGLHLFQRNDGCRHCVAQGWENCAEWCRKGLWDIVGWLFWDKCEGKYLSKRNKCGCEHIHKLPEYSLASACCSDHGRRSCGKPWQTMANSITPHSRFDRSRVSYHLQDELLMQCFGLPLLFGGHWPVLWYQLDGW